MYPTLKATVRQGQIQLLEEAKLPENTNLLVVVLDAIDPGTLTPVDHLIAGLQDMSLGHVITTSTPEELAHHLDTVFDES